MKRIFLVLTVALVMAAMVVATAVPAFADANPNAHNCQGSAVSGAVPQNTQGGVQGSRVSGQAQSGLRAETVHSEQTPNCG